MCGSIRDLPLLHGVCESEGRAGLRRDHPRPGPADGLLRLPADQTDLAGLQYAHAPSFIHTPSITLLMMVILTPSLFCSDHPGYRGGRRHPPAHLPQEENHDCHRPHQRGQQVSVSWFHPAFHPLESDQKCPPSQGDSY